DKDAHLRKIVIGIADGGLGNAKGHPLPEKAFDKNTQEQSDDNDDDDNQYVDDIIGAGLRRTSDDLMGSGDVSLCTPAPDFTNWNSKVLEKASHGAVVSSI